MKARHILIVTLSSLLVLTGACSSSDDGGGDDTADSVATDPDSTDGTDSTAGGDGGETTTASAESASLTCEEVAASFATRGSANPDLPDPEVAATCDGDTVTVTANGIPDFTYVATSPGTPEAVTQTFTLPAEPTEATDTTEVPLLGAAAIAVDGVPIYGPTEATGADVGSLGEQALSECGSHNGPTGFHFHKFGTSGTTDCLYAPEEVAEEPQLFGFALDGYPIYTGNDLYTSSWQLTDESLYASDTWSAHSYVEGSGDLDECNGMVLEDGSYAYFTTDEFPYVLGCYRGEVDLTTSGGGLPEGGPAGQAPPV